MSTKWTFWLAGLVALGQLSACGGGAGEPELPVAPAVQPAALPPDTTAQQAAAAILADLSTPLNFDVEDPLRVARSSLSRASENTPEAGSGDTEAAAVVLPEYSAETTADAGLGRARILAAGQAQAAISGLNAQQNSLILNANATAAENWAGAQLKVQQQAAWASWIQSRKATIDAWTAKPRERAALIAGYMHDYVDPNTGLPLAWTPQTPEPPVGTTIQQQKLHRAWVFYLRSYNITRLGDAARVFRATNDTRYRDWAAAQLDFYATNYNLWPLRTLNGRGRLYQHGLDEATASFTLLDAARLLTGYVSTAQSEHWRRNLFAPMATNLQTVGAPMTNIGLWHAAAVARIGMRYRDSALVYWGLSGALGTRATLASELNADNMWDEGSFSYNAYVIDALNALATAAGVEGYSNSIVTAERDALAKLLLAPLAMRFDNGRLPTPGNATPLAAIDANLHASVYRVLPTWWGLSRAQSMQTWDTLLQTPAAPPQEPVLPPIASRNFAATRMAVLRASSWQAYVHYGQTTINHAQQEALTYELHEGTRALSSDTGTVSYTSPYHVNYFSQGASHNVPLVDGLGQQRWTPGVVDAFDAGSSVLRISHPGYQPAVDVTRQFQVANTGFQETTSLRSTTGSARRLGSAFHTGCSIIPFSGLMPLGLGTVSPPANASTAYWTNLKPYMAFSNWSVLLSCGSANYVYKVTGPGSQRVFIGLAPTTPLPGSRSVMYYEANTAAASYQVGISGR